LIRWYWRVRAWVLLRPVAWTIAATNLLAGIVGFIYWYGPTLVRYPAWQWVFVPDCPLFALLFVASLLLILAKRNWPPYDALVAFGLIKYGIWTVSVWVLYWAYTRGDFSLESVTMTVAHLGMILEGLFLLSFLKLDWPTVVACVLWFGLSDWMDYGPLQTFPHFPMSSLPLGVAPSFSYLDLMQGEMIAVTLLIGAGYALATSRRQRAGLMGG
jgi:uncharacterized membrane protein YpjA